MNGTWRSLVAHYAGGVGVVGSNPAVPKALCGWFVFGIFPVTVLIGFLSIMIAQGLVTAFLPLYATNIHESPLFVGGLYSAYFLGVVLGSFLTEKWLLKMPGDRLTVMLLAILAALSAAIGICHNAAVWIILRFCVGIVTGGCFILVELYALTTPQKRRRRALSVYFFTLYGGMTVGALLLNLYSSSTEIDASEASLYFLTCIFFQVVAIIMNLFVRFPDMVMEEVVEPFFSTVKKIIKPAIITGMGGALVGSANAHMPGFGRMMGYSLRYTSVLVSLAIVGGGCLCLPSAWLANKHGDMRAAFVVVTIGIACDLCMILFDLPEMGTVFLITLFAIGSGMPLYMLGLSRASLESTSTTQFVRFAAILGVAFATGAIIGPMYTGLFIVMTHKGLFLSNATVKALVMLFLVFSGALKKKAPYSLDEGAKVMDAGLSIIFAGLARRSMGKRMRKRIDKRGKKR